VDIEIQAREIMYHKANLNRILAYHCNQPVTKVDEDTDRDRCARASPAQRLSRTCTPCPTHTTQLWSRSLPHIPQREEGRSHVPHHAGGRCVRGSERAHRGITVSSNKEVERVQRTSTCAEKAVGSWRDVCSLADFSRVFTCSQRRHVGYRV
jgi:hypothetical protein